MRYHELQRVLILAGLATIIAGFVTLTFGWPVKNYGPYYRNIPLGFRTIVPALTYGMTLLLIGIGYLRIGRLSSTVLMSILLILANSGFMFVMVDFLITPYSEEFAFDFYFFIVQTIAYPWVIANVAGISYFVINFKHQETR